MRKNEEGEIRSEDADEEEVGKKRKNGRKGKVKNGEQRRGYSITNH